MITSSPPWSRRCGSKRSVVMPIIAVDALGRERVRYLRCRAECFCVSITFSVFGCGWQHRCPQREECKRGIPGHSAASLFLFTACVCLFYITAVFQVYRPLRQSVVVPDLLGKHPGRGLIHGGLQGAAHVLRRMSPSPLQRSGKS